MKWLEEIKKSQAKFHKDRIKQVLSEEVPQHILASKELADALTVGEDGYCRTEAGFFLKEKLVNRLMYLSYLHGRADIDERSFAAGRDKALEMMREALEKL
jgi:hypothetical protein